MASREAQKEPVLRLDEMVRVAMSVPLKDEPLTQCSAHFSQLGTFPVPTGASRRYVETGQCSGHFDE